MSITSYNYIDAHIRDIKRAKELYAIFHKVIYGRGWVEIGGEYINGINKDMMEKIICELGM